MNLALRYEALMDQAALAGPDAGFLLVCVLCGRSPERESANRCAECGGAVDAVHDLGRASIPSDGEPLQRYFDLLPLKNRKSIIGLGEGNTPCRPATDLGRRVGLPRLVLKIEGDNPTRSTKDRIASLGLSRFAELGVKRFVMASTGNSSTAYARGVQAVAGMELALFCGYRFRHRLGYPDHPSVSTYLVEGDFVAAGQVSRRFAARTGAFAEGGFFNLARREGLKLAYLEAFDRMDPAPDAVFQAVSSGMGLLGGYKGALEYRRLGRLPRVPRFVAVQQDACAPMAHAYRERAAAIAPRHIVHEPRGPAEAILRGDPTATYPYIRDLCRESGGAITAVTEAEIRAARCLLAEDEGVNACNAGAAALAGAVRMRREGGLSADDTVLVNLTGADREDRSAPTRYRVVPPDWATGPVDWDGPAETSREAAGSWAG
ncbi:threonine synthase [Murinocardiopsis flavida]|uniref:Threonine synthase n=1 Tax=Murinocardiopsis flavida TaxID=645275 RepID=A0A2P8CWS7_9ACTN|nr:threonine synthase [Murinocardiopsis flavida]